MPLILIADDDRHLVDTLMLALGTRFQTCNASTGASILYQLVTEKPDLVLLDQGLPDVDGGILLQTIRRASSVPIIVLSGRQAQVDRVLALRAGADDFVGKPFDLDDLEARIDAVLRRCHRVPVPSATAPLQVGSLQMFKDGAQRIDGVALHFSPTERRLLVGLVERAGQVVTPAELALGIWGTAEGYSRGTIDTVLDRVRARLRGHVRAPQIETIRGRGFRIQAREAA